MTMAPSAIQAVREHIARTLGVDSDELILRYDPEIEERIWCWRSTGAPVRIRCDYHCDPFAMVRGPGDWRPPVT